MQPVDRYADLHYRHRKKYLAIFVQYVMGEYVTRRVLKKKNFYYFSTATDVGQRQTDRQTDRQTETHTERGRQRQRGERLRERQRQRETHTERRRQRQRGERLRERQRGGRDTEREGGER